MLEESALNNLRNSPINAIKSHLFCLEQNPTNPGLITLAPRKKILQHKQITLFATNGGTRDYYFPFVSNGKGGIGCVTVPSGKINGGGIAITPGMNGCALEIRKDQNNLYFYHDSDGKHIKRDGNNNSLIIGDRKYRLEFQDYESKFRYDEGRIAKGNFFIYQFICVLQRNMVEVVGFGLYLDGTQKVTGSFGAGHFGGFQI